MEMLGALLGKSLAEALRVGMIDASVGYSTLG
jgi:hypothetical protein